MVDANSRQVALQNLREFQEMSYADVYALILQKRFEEAKSKYQTVLKSMNVADFNAALTLNITTPHDNLLDCMSEMASKVSTPEKIRAVGFDLSAHLIYHNNDGRLSQGVEVSLYSEDAYDFINASDTMIRLQCETAASEWQGAFLDIESCALDGLGALAQQFADHAHHQNNLQGIIQKQNGNVIVDPVAIARHVAKLLLAIEYHRYMAEFVEEVEVPSEMVFIIGEHDEIEVPIVFYRVGQAQPKLKPNLTPRMPIEKPQVLNAEDTPSMYQEQMPVEDNASYHEDEALQHYDAVYTESVEQTCEENAEPLMEEQPEVFSDEVNAEVSGKVNDETIAAGKASFGIAPRAKTFGQLSNKLFTLEEEEQDAEKSA